MYFTASNFFYADLWGFHAQFEALLLNSIDGNIKPKYGFYYGNVELSIMGLSPLALVATYTLAHLLHYYFLSATKEFWLSLRRSGTV